MTTFTGADGAVFYALIEEMPDGMWRASGVVRLDKKSKVQSSGVEICPTEEAARAWVDKAARSRGFNSCKLQVRRQPLQRA